MSESEPRFRMLVPEPATVTAAEVLDRLELTGAAPAHRPYTVVNFVASADGRAAFRGRSAPLSDPGDRSMFHGLRERVDAVLAGTGTLRTERYGRLVRDPDRRARRAAHGLAPDPVACVITRSGEVPTEIPLFADAGSRVLLFSSQPVALDGVAARVETIVLDPAVVTMTTMMRLLRRDYDVRALLCEGGPTVFGALLREELVDELFLTVAPRLNGGGSDPPSTVGPDLPAPIALDLAWALEREGTLFLRYTRHGAPGGAT